VGIVRCVTEAGEGATGSGARKEPGHVRALDGMRAIAVLLVLLFHLRIPWFRAGFLGVDVFFVLSGFLITSLLLEEIRRTGRVSLPEFWARRARRLLPAVVLVLLVLSLTTSMTTTYTERPSVRGDLLATTGYVANWRLISTSSYFADTGVDSPVEHTWSLAIEEQFYLAWPLLVLGVATLGNGRGPASASSRSLGPACRRCRWRCSGHRARWNARTWGPTRGSSSPCWERRGPPSSRRRAAAPASSERARGCWRLARPRS
jgi:peptidoglycan/LPS O-acetylase OafA/YrhL